MLRRIIWNYIKKKLIFSINETYEEKKYMSRRIIWNYIKKKKLSKYKVN